MKQLQITARNNAWLNGRDCTTIDVTTKGPVPTAAEMERAMREAAGRTVLPDPIGGAARAIVIRTTARTEAMPLAYLLGIGAAVRALTKHPKQKRLSYWATMPGEGAHVAVRLHPTGKPRNRDRETATYELTQRKR